MQIYSATCTLYRIPCQVTAPSCMRERCYNNNNTHIVLILGSLEKALSVTALSWLSDKWLHVSTCALREAGLVTTYRWISPGRLANEAACSSKMKLLSSDLYYNKQKISYYSWQVGLCHYCSVTHYMHNLHPLQMLKIWKCSSWDPLQLVEPQITKHEQQLMSLEHIMVECVHLHYITQGVQYPWG